MKTLRQLFQEKAEVLELQSLDYINKTVDQMSNLSKEKKEEVAKQIVWFLRMKDVKQLQVKFNNIAGLVNDLQMQMFSGFERTCKDCDCVLKNNTCYNCDI